jgi:two-component system phosphate regulon sensor histidine kinase PhoR
MINRWFLFAAFGCLGGLLGWLMRGPQAIWPSVVLASVFWLAFDSLRFAYLQRWLRALQMTDRGVASDHDTAARPPGGGAWGDMADRVRRLLRSRDLRQQESQARLDEFLLAMQASPNGVVLLDAEGRIEWWNQTASQHFGFEADRDTTQYVANLVREPAFTAYLAAGQFQREVVIPGNGSTPARPVKLAVHAHPYGQGRKLLLSRDITAVELAEAMRRDFVANVSHEIRTPLTVLAGFIETLQNLPLNEVDRTRYLGLMAQQSQRMQTLVNDLLTLSRLEGSPVPGSGEWVSVQCLLAQCEQEALALSAVLSQQGQLGQSERQAHQLVFLEGPAAEVAGVQAELFSALSNLVSNAVRYTPAPGTVRVSWRVLEGGQGELSVEDSGPGIAPEHLPRLTERFYRVDRSRSRETGGTGLGLAIVKHVTQRHGAELKIQSRLGHGSTFTISFPPSRVRLARSEQPAPAGEQRATART